MNMTDPFADGWTQDDMEAAIERNVPEELLYVPVWVSMDPPDCTWAEAICVQLASHNHTQVRANAILGFGHLARTCRKLNLEVVKPILLSALNDTEEAIRTQADDAIDDVEHYLSCTIR